MKMIFLSVDTIPLPYFFVGGLLLLIPIVYFVNKYTK